MQGIQKEGGEGDSGSGINQDLRTKKVRFVQVAILHFSKDFNYITRCLHKMSACILLHLYTICGQNHSYT